MSAPSIAQSVATAPGFRPTEQGYPGGLTEPTAFNPLTAHISYIPSDFHSSPVQSWYVSLQREFGPRMLVDVAYVGNKADDLLLVANYNQAAVNNSAGTIPLAGAPADPDLRAISPMSSTAASRATTRCRPSSSGAWRRTSSCSTR